MAATMSQTAFAEAKGLTILRNFAQSRANNLGQLSYERLPLVQPVDYLSWPWIKKEKLLREYLRFERKSPFFGDLKVDYSPLLWCEQARDEALQFFCEENFLIRVTIHAEDHKDLEPDAILLPQDELRVPIELFDEKMLGTLEAGVTLRLQIGEGCGKGPTTAAKNVVYDQIFGYNQHTWAEYCQTLASNGLRKYSGVIISLHQRYRSNFQELLPDFILELAYVRSAGKVWLAEMAEVKFFDTLAAAMSDIPYWPWHWHDLLLGLIEESEHRTDNESLNAGFVILSRANTCAEIALLNTSSFSSQPGFDDQYRPFINGTYSLCTKIFVDYVRTVHHILNSKTRNGVYPPSTIGPMKKMYKAMTNARTWPGMGPQQLASFFFAAGLCHVHIASFLSSSNNMEAARNDPQFRAKLDIDLHRLRATHCLYAAAKVSPPEFEQVAMDIWEDLYKEHGSGKPREFFVPKLETMSTKTGGEWYGIPSLWEKWGKDKLHDLEKLREVITVGNSKSQMKKSREKTGATNCRKNGLLRCIFVD